MDAAVNRDRPQSMITSIEPLLICDRLFFKPNLAPMVVIKASWVEGDKDLTQIASRSLLHHLLYPFQPFDAVRLESGPQVRARNPHKSLCIIGFGQGDDDLHRSSHPLSAGAIEHLLLFIGQNHFSPSPKAFVPIHSRS